MDGNVEIELYAMYAVYCYNLDPISRMVDKTSPARVVALVAYCTLAECIVHEYNDSFPDIAFYRELDHTQRLDVDFTPLPFE